MSNITATDLTREHYTRPGVKELILKFCTGEDRFRALNGDSGWYKQGNGLNEVSLTTPDDYDDIVNKYRTLYTTLDVLENSVKFVCSKWDAARKATVAPIGTLQNCLAYTLSVDIDSLKTTDGKGIRDSPETKKAVETAAQFFVDYLKERGVHRSIHCLYSGGGVYIHVHHKLWEAGKEWTREDREQAFRSLTMAFNELIGVVAYEFFLKHPEYKKMVKFDCLNNQKRKFKCLLSIHKKMPVAVIPLNPSHIEIDFGRATLPLADDVIEECKTWYEDYDVAEKDILKTILGTYLDSAAQELKDRKKETGSFAVGRLAHPVQADKFPPCIKNILEHASPDKGPHRALAVLAAYLYQVRWPEDIAFKVWSEVADRCGVESRIFDCWFGQMSCPSCKTLQKVSAGYPNVGLGGLGYCTEACKMRR